MLTEWEDRTMSRDMALILTILRYVRDNATCDGAVPERNFNPEHSTAKTRYHIRLCIQAGFLDASDSAPGTLDSVQVYALTWRGHEFLEKKADL